MSAPERLDDEAVRLAVVSKLNWIRRKQRDFIGQPRQSRREMVTGESHYFRGRRYRLRVLEDSGPAQVLLRGSSEMLLRIRPGSDTAKREQVLNNWYRSHLKSQLPDLISHWQSFMSIEVADWGVKRMKTRWGSCNIRDRRIWLNLELAKKPPACLEYVLVHEMTHLLERHHNGRFKSLMDFYLPNWPIYREELNRTHLAYENWT